jgi:hypothetical protein
MRGKSPKFQLSWYAPYKVIIRIDDVFYRIQRHLRLEIMVVLRDKLASYVGPAMRGEQCRGLTDKD